MADDDLVCPPPVFTCDHQALVIDAFTLNYRDVEDLLAEHGLNVSYGTVLGPLFAGNFAARRPRPTSQWRFNETA